jgi:hypothetical protein
MISDTTVRFWGDCRAAILPATLLRNTALRNAPHLRMDWRSMLHFIETIGAGEGNRTPRHQLGRLLLYHFDPVLSIARKLNACRHFLASVRS